MVLQSKRIGRFFMIGVYDYTVIATYLSLLLGLGGLYSAARFEPLDAMLCLMLAGLLDAFDGRIARTKKDRTEQEKRFGIQIDSLNDLVCFGVLPAAALVLLAAMVYLLVRRGYRGEKELRHLTVSAARR